MSALKFIESGRGQARRVMFLHGFPEGAFVWEPVMSALSSELHAIAPWLRGYAPSPAPPEPAAYRPKALVSDLVALIEALGAPLDLLVAHDWGGALAWNLAASHPRLLRRLLIINAPHPAMFLRELRFSAAQQAASAYMLRLIEPQAESWLAADDFSGLWPFFGRARWLDEPMRRRYREQWSAGLTGPLNFYRASPLRPPAGADDPLHHLDLPRELTQVDIPTTVLWGERDRALLPSLLDGLSQHVADLEIVRVPEASHWLVHEQPQRVIDQVRRLASAALASPISERGRS